MNVLYTEIVTDSMGVNIFWGVITGIFAIIFIVAGIAEIIYDHKVGLGVGVMLLSLFAGGLSYTSFTTVPATHKYVECTFVPGYSISVDELQNYKLIEQRGEIYRFEIVNNDN